MNPPSQQQMVALRSQVSAGQVSVEVDAGPQVDLGAIMAEIRQEYEAIANKNNKQLEDWYNQKVRVQKPLVVFQTELKLLFAQCLYVTSVTLGRSSDFLFSLKCRRWN